MKHSKKSILSNKNMPICCLWQSFVLHDQAIKKIIQYICLSREWREGDLIQNKVSQFAIYFTVLQQSKIFEISIVSLVYFLQM